MSMKFGKFEKNIDAFAGQCCASFSDATVKPANELSVTTPAEPGGMNFS